MPKSRRASAGAAPSSRRPTGHGVARRPSRSAGAVSGERSPGVPWLVAGAIVVVVLIAVFVVFRPSSTAPGGSRASASARRRRPARSPIGRRRACPTSQPPALPAGETRTVTLTTPKGAIAIKVEADLSPIAAGNFVALASCGFYDGTVFHRTPTLQDGTPFVIQGGDPDGTGTGGPGYTIKDEPVTTPYKRGTVAMARSQRPEQRRLAVLHRPRRQGRRHPRARPTPTRSSATSRPAWRSPTRSSSPRAASSSPRTRSRSRPRPSPTPDPPTESKRSTT